MLRATPEDAPARTFGLLVHMLVGIRMVQLLPWPIALAVGARFMVANPVLPLTSYALQTVWSLFYAIRALRTGTLPDWVVATDVIVASVCLVMSGRGWAAANGTSWGNSAVYPAIGVALSTAVVWWPTRAVAAGVLLALCYVIGVLPELRTGGSIIASTAGNVLSLVGFSVVAGLISSQLMRSARTAAATTAAMLEARERAAGQRARYEERQSQYRILHDTVLSTLTAIARGADSGAGQLRQRCSAEADLIRGMISNDAEPTTSLAVELALVVHHQAALGLRVHCQISDMPEELPPEVIAALTGSCREALNNVAKHAGTDEAWVTAHGGPGGEITITVVDRGRGFDSRALTPGLGLDRSIAARMTEAGGSSFVDSQTGQGTSVELRWPK